MIEIETDPELLENDEGGDGDDEAYDHLAVETIPFDLAQFEDEDE